MFGRMFGKRNDDQERQDAGKPEFYGPGSGGGERRHRRNNRGGGNRAMRYGRSVITGLEISNELYDAIKRDANEHGVSMYYVVRGILQNHYFGGTES